MDLGLAERVYVVTGGSRGIGRACAQALVDEGARVVVSARSADKVDAAVAELGPERAAGLAADNADPSAPARLVELATTRFGRLDGAVVSVGGPPAGTVLETSDGQWQAAFDSVFLGAVRLARTVGSALAEGDGGALALVLSSSVRSPLAAMAISNGLRPGLAMLVKQLAGELGPRRVRVLGLLPGSIATDRQRELALAAGRDPEEAKAAASATIPLRRFGSPEEFGRVAAFVLSPAASYLTGSMIAVDGGSLPAP